MIQWVSVTLIAILVFTVGISCASKNKDASGGLVDNKLQPCPSTPNCVCSEYSSAKSSIPPVSIKDDRQTAWRHAISIIKEMGGTIIQEKDNYVHATFTSKIFRFVDDFELRLDPTQNLIHLRSASRIGHSDLGVNRKRAEKFKSLLESKLGAQDVHPGN